MKKFYQAVMVTLTAAAMTAPSSFGTATLELDDGISPSVTVVDGNGDGTVVFVGSIGLWTVNVTTGITKPTLGSAANPEGDLNTVNVSGGAGTLTIRFSDNDYTGTGMVAHSLGGTTTGSVSYQVYFDDSNTTLSTPAAGLLFDYSAGPGPGPFSFDGDVGEISSSPYSITQVLTITHVGSGGSSGDFRYTVGRTLPDGGMTLVTLGMGMLGIAVFRRCQAT